MSTCDLRGRRQSEVKEVFTLCSSIRQTLRNVQIFTQAGHVGVLGKANRANGSYIKIA